MTSEVSEAKTIHPVPRYASWLTALRCADELHAECVRLAAENARLRQGLVLIARCIRDQANRYARTKLQADDDELQRLIGVFNLPDDRLIEAALQEAIYREGGE